MFVYQLLVLKLMKGERVKMSEAAWRMIQLFAWRLDHYFGITMSDEVIQARIAYYVQAE